MKTQKRWTQPKYLAHPTPQSYIPTVISPSYRPPQRRLWAFFRKPFYKLLSIILMWIIVLVAYSIVGEVP